MAHTPPHITPKQANWFRAIKEGLEKDTGKSMDEWIAIAKTCPEAKQGARLKWFKDNHGLAQNRALTIIGAAFDTGFGWDNPAELLDQLWKTTDSRDVYDVLEKMALSLGNDVVVGPRKSFSGFSRKYQFAAARPTRDAVRLGLALPLDQAAGCKAPKSSDSWSGRLKSVIILNNINDINANVKSLLKQAYELS